MRLHAQQSAGSDGRLGPESSWITSVKWYAVMAPSPNWPILVLLPAFALSPTLRVKQSRSRLLKAGSLL